jgi:hypothetical protein
MSFFPSKLHEFLSLYANGDKNSLIGLARAEDSINDKYDAVIGLARVGASTNTVDSENNHAISLVNFCRILSFAFLTFWPEI